MSKAEFPARVAPQFSADRLGRVHQVLAGYVERGEMPGIAAVMSRRGEVHIETVGTLAFDSKEPIREDTIFRIASLSKPIVSAAAMILMEEGKLRLDEPVDRWLPELANRRVLKQLDSPLDDTVAARRPITVRDLLTFRMGFGLAAVAPDAYPILKAANELGIVTGPPHPAKTPAPDEWMRRLGTLPLMHQPGEKWMYHFGAEVLSVLIARITGQPLETFLRARLLEPLGMKDTSFSVPPEKIGRFVTSYWDGFGTGKLSVYDEAKGGEWSKPPAFPSGGGGMVSTANDYLAFAQMMLDYGRRGKEQILSRASVELMTTDQLTPAQKAVSGLVDGYFDSHGWGFCMEVVTRREELFENVGSYGWNGGLGQLWSNDPREGTILILLTQKAWTSPAPPSICQDFGNAMYQAIAD